MANPKPPTSAKDWYGLSLGLPIVIMATRGSDPHVFLSKLLSIQFPISSKAFPHPTKFHPSLHPNSCNSIDLFTVFRDIWKEPPLKNEHSRKSGRCHQPRKTSPRMSSLLWPLFDVWRLSLRLTPVDKGQGRMP